MDPSVLEQKEKGTKTEALQKRGWKFSPALGVVATGWWESRGKNMQATGVISFEKQDDGPRTQERRRGEIR